MAGWKDGAIGIVGLLGTLPWALENALYYLG